MFLEGKFWYMTSNFPLAIAAIYTSTKSLLPYPASLYVVNPGSVNQFDGQDGI